VHRWPGHTAGHGQCGCFDISKTGQHFSARDVGHAYAMIDGTLIPIDRVAADRPFYSGKHRRHGMNLQVISAPDGEIVWVSGPLPGVVHDLTAARIWGIIRELAAAGLVVLADKGYHGAGDPVLIPYRGRNKPASQKDANRAMPSCDLPASAPTPSSRTGTSCASSAAAPGRPGSWLRPSTSFKPTRSQDEKGSLWIRLPSLNSIRGTGGIALVDPDVAAHART
jgi:hypothetical protein